MYSTENLTKWGMARDLTDYKFGRAPLLVGCPFLNSFSSHLNLFGHSSFHQWHCTPASDTAKQRGTFTFNFSKLIGSTHTPNFSNLFNFSADICYPIPYIRMWLVWCMIMLRTEDPYIGFPSQPCADTFTLSSFFIHPWNFRVKCVKTILDNYWTATRNH